MKRNQRIKMMPKQFLNSGKINIVRWIRIKFYSVGKCIPCKLKITNPFKIFSGDICHHPDVPGPHMPYVSQPILII